MTIQELNAMIGKTGRMVPTTGQPEWSGKFIVTRVDPGRLIVRDEIEGDRYTGATLTVESVARGVEYPATGAAPIETSDPFERAEGFPADWFVPDA
jgi:hypothetical protein